MRETKITWGENWENIHIIDDNLESKKDTFYKLGINRKNKVITLSYQYIEWKKCLHAAPTSCSQSYLLLFDDNKFFKKQLKIIKTNYLDFQYCSPKPEIYLIYPNTFEYNVIHKIDLEYLNCKFVRSSIGCERYLITHINQIDMTNKSYNQILEEIIIHNKPIINSEIKRIGYNYIHNIELHFESLFENIYSVKLILNGSKKNYSN